MSNPRKTIRLVQWTVEIDYSFEIDDERTDEEIFHALVDGEFEEIKKEIGSRISGHYPISVNPINYW